MPTPVELWIKDSGTDANRPAESDDFAGGASSGGDLQVGGSEVSNLNPVPVQQSALRGNPTGGVISSAMTGTTSTIAGAIPTAGLSHYVTTITVSNTGSVDTDVLIQDGSGGTTKYIVPAPAGGGAGKVGGSTITLPDPIKLTVNTAVYMANVTTGAAVKASWAGFEL